MIVMVDGIPGCRKAEIISYMHQKCPRHIMAMCSNVIEVIPTVKELFDTTNLDLFHNSVVTSQMYLISALLDCLNQIMVQTIPTHSMFVIESSIFWPWMWIETFFQLELLTMYERKTLLDMMQCVIQRWGEYIRRTKLQFVHIMIQRELNRPYMVMGETHTFQMKSQFWELYPNFWWTMSYNYDNFSKYISSFINIVIPQEQFNRFIFCDYVEEGHRFSVETMGNTIIERLEKLNETTTGIRLEKDPYVTVIDLDI